MAHVMPNKHVRMYTYVEYHRPLSFQKQHYFHLCLTKSTRTRELSWVLRSHVVEIDDVEKYGQSWPSKLARKKTVRMNWKRELGDA